jgi:murein L,D-transpeptidase YafK
MTNPDDKKAVPLFLQVGFKLKSKSFKYTAFFLGALLFILSVFEVTSRANAEDRALAARLSVKPTLEKELALKGLSYGSPIFIRIFKQSSILELWVASETGEFKKFKDYDICTFSGNLGPKLKEGDRQSPEGFYFVKAGSMNPWSKFHLSFNLGFPNAYDRAHGRTGSALMVHGACVSIGCYAMTDSYIEEIYTLASAALQNGQPFFRVHAFPFELSEQNLANHTEHEWYPFWQNLKGGFDYFEKHKKPPNVIVNNKTYIFEAD